MFRAVLGLAGLSSACRRGSRCRIFLGVVYGFLSFAGFEAAATLGEETKHPNRDIPRAILGVAIFGGIYFVVVTAVEAMGFGTSAKGVATFVHSSSLVGDLGIAYVSSWIGNVIAIAWFAVGTDPLTLFFAAGTIGTLILLVVYILATIGMVKMVFFSDQSVVRRWEIVIPTLAIVVLGYTLFRNVYPFPSGGLWWGPGTAAAWLLVGIVGTTVLATIINKATDYAAFGKTAGAVWPGWSTQVSPANWPLSGRFPRSRQSTAPGRRAN